MIRIGNNQKPNVLKDDFFKADGVPCVIQGVEILDALCPVSKKTGLRENPLTLVRKLVNDSAKAAMLAQMLVELPTDSSQASLSDEEKFEFCMQRLNIGTPAENEDMRQVLEEVFDNAASQLKALNQKPNSSIDFKPADAPSVDA